MLLRVIDRDIDGRMEKSGLIPQENYIRFLIYRPRPEGQRKDKAGGAGGYGLPPLSEGARRELSQAASETWR